MKREELEALLKQHGWFLHMQRRHCSDFAYAKKQLDRKHGITRYIKAKSKFEELTVNEVLKRIQL